MANAPMFEGLTSALAAQLLARQSVIVYQPVG